MATSARTIALGDIHGCSKALAAILDILQLQPADTLITLGDYVNKGPDSRGVIEQMLALQKRCQLIPLLGNHDAVMIAAVEGRLPLQEWLSKGGSETLASYPDCQIASIPDEHIDFLRQCLLYHETSAHIFVHASYVPELPMDQQDESVLLWEKIRDQVPTPHRSGKTAIVGHTSQKDGEIVDAGHLICIDTNCCEGGWLTALDVEAGTLWQIDQQGTLRASQP